MSEPVTSPPLARVVHDRDATRRASDAIEAELDNDPATRVVAVHAGRALFAERVDGTHPALDLRHPSVLPEPHLRAYLGRDDTGSPVELRVFDETAVEAIASEAARWVELRAAVPLLEPAQAALAVESVALSTWHSRHPFCPLCGAQTEVVQAGWARRCQQDGSLHFPRTDPAVIVLVTDDDDRVLLGSNALWEQGRFSLLAGFVEPGESLEAAVIREVGEEAGIAVDRVRYCGSQPWPFPASLMVGFTARVAEGLAAAGATPDGEEILELRWLSRDDLAVARRDVVLPGETSIARWLLEQWFGGPLGDSEPWFARDAGS